jgi:hypothetical protein
MTRHVFKENADGLHFLNNPANVGPQVARIVLPTASAGGTERLARVARNDEVHASTPASPVEGSGIRPNRSRIQLARFHAADQFRAGEGFPFRPADDAASWHRQSEAGIESGPAGAEG